MDKMDADLADICHRYRPDLNISEEDERWVEWNLVVKELGAVAEECGSCTQNEFIKRAYYGPESEE